MKYKVERTYTPDSQHGDRTRVSAKFESEEIDIVKLALQAQLACLGGSVTPEMVNHCRFLVDESRDQLEDQESDEFEVILFGNSGEWLLEVERIT